MHEQARRFTEFVRAHFPDFFHGKTVLDVGSGDVNGNNRYLFVSCDYHGNDVDQGDNVTIVSRTKDLPFPPESFDTIISTECFEHDPEYNESIRKIYSLLKPGGLFAFTCASLGRPEHGTSRSHTADSFASRAKIEDMQDYYRNLTISDIYNAAPLGQVFEQWRAYYHITASDLYFIGQKHGGSDTPTAWAKIPEYRDPTQPYFVSRVYPGELYTISPELFSTILRRQ
jgi:SAM-dependent methyltransferase